MIRGLNIILSVTSLLALGGVYTLKYTTADTASEKLALERTVDRQEADLSIVKADWAYLTQPGHIGPMVRRHVDVLELEIVEQKQFVRFEDLPMRVAATTDDADLTALFEALEQGIDPIAALIEASSE